MRRTIATVIGSRANYASIKSVLKELSRRPDVELELYVGAGALLSKYGNVADIIQSDGFTVTERFYMLVEGETPETMAMSTGLGIIRLAGIFQNRRPDLVISVGDRFETMATAVSAAYLNIRVAHTMGGAPSTSPSDTPSPSWPTCTSRPTRERPRASSPWARTRRTCL
jgi:UDP-N-acetylglucosamine 2-epimerase